MPAAQHSPIDGFWLGILQTATQSLRIQVTAKSDSSGQEFCTLDSLDQSAFNLACANVVYSGNDFPFDIPVVKGHWGGKPGNDGSSLLGICCKPAPKFDQVFGQTGVEG